VRHRALSVAGKVRGCRLINSPPEEAAPASIVARDGYFKCTR
jgi:hypothetical protein